MSLEIRSAHEFASHELIHVLNKAFKGYIAGSIELSSSSFQHFCSSQGVNLALSHVAIKESKLIALALIARRGWTSRLASMGIHPDYQAKGVGTKLMQALIQQAQKRQDRLMSLEVIEQNPAALMLYKRVGFKALRQLFEGRLDNAQIASVRRPEAIDIIDAASFIAAHAPKDLPWQVSAFNLVTFAEPNVALKLDDAVMIISNPQADEIRILNITVAKDKHSQGEAKRLLQAAIAQYPNKSWYYAALCPKESEGFFLKQGFKRGKLSQLQMQLDIQAAQVKH